jgi:hypothetical protein
MVPRAARTVKWNLTAGDAAPVIKQKYLLFYIKDLYSEWLPAAAPSRNLRGRGAALRTGLASSGLDLAGCRRM